MGNKSKKEMFGITARPKIDNDKIRQMLKEGKITIQEALAHEKDKDYYNRLLGLKKEHDSKHKKDYFER